MSEDEPVSRPSDTINYVAKSRNIPVESLRIPQYLVLTYQKGTFDCAKDLVKGDYIEWLYPENTQFCVGDFNDSKVGVGRFGMGAPATAFSLEEAIVCGVRIIFEVGVSGSIQPYLQAGEIIVVSGAIRDEGTSHHYFPPEVKVESDTLLKNKLIERLKRNGIKHFVGPVWSTDGVYRETRGKLRKFRESGVLAVNMETSAVFAIAKYRNVRAASAQVISDVLTENGCDIASEHQSVRESTEALLKNVLETISKHKRGGSSCP